MLLLLYFRECLYLFVEYDQRDSNEPIEFALTVTFLGRFCKSDLFVIFLGYLMLSIFFGCFGGYALSLSSSVRVSAYVLQLQSSTAFTRDLYNLILVEVLSLFPFIQASFRLLRATIASCFFFSAFSLNLKKICLLIFC